MISNISGPRHRFRELSWLGLVAAFLIGSGCAPGGERPTENESLPNIVVIVIDTLRADHLGTYGYFRDTSPNLDRLAEQAAVFENTVTTMTTTLPAHVSLWSSRYPIQTGVVTNGMALKREKGAGNEVRFFAEMLKGLGYQTAGFVSANPVKRYTGLNAGFDVYDQPEPDQGGRLGSASHTTDAVLEWLGSGPREPFFLWVHYFDPHDPYAPPPPYDESFESTPEQERWLGRHGVSDPRNPEFVRFNNLYDGEILFVDSQIQRVLDRLGDLGLYDDLALVVTADHGEALGDHGEIGHTEIYNGQLFVPLIMKFPAGSGLNGRRFDHIVSLVDVVPTLVDRLDLPIADSDRDQFEGRDALAGRTPRQYALSQRTYRLDGDPAKARVEKFALVGLDWKYTYRSGKRDRLIDMRRDRAENFDVLTLRPEIAEDLRERLLGDLARLESSSGGLEVMEVRSPRVLEELRALGYLD